MTAEQKAEYKKEVKEAINQFLKANSLTNSEPQVIMTHLVNMYRHLEDKNLVKYGLTYQLFNKFAQESFVYQQMMGQFR
jgi:hypothetical protein